jgi:hypothetical protein
MRGALLFLTTIMVITPGGRNNIGDFLDRTCTLYTEAAPYSTMMIALAVCMALLLPLMVRRPAPARCQIVLIRSEISAAAFDGTAPIRPMKRRFHWSRILPAFLFQRLAKSRS